MAPPGAGEPAAPSLERIPFSLAGPELEGRAAVALRSVEQALEALRGSEEVPSVASFLVPLNRIWLAIGNVEAHGRLMFLTHPDPTVRAAGRAVQEKGEELVDRLQSDPILFQRLRAMACGDADPATRYAVERLLLLMRLAGAGLGGPERAELIELRRKVRSASNEFSENIQRWAREIVLPSAESLAGLPAEFVAQHPAGADAAVRLRTRPSETNPVLAMARSEATRRTVLTTVQNRGYPENTAVLERIRALRAELALRSGYPDFAAYDLATRMLRTPEAAALFLREVHPQLRAAAVEADRALLERKRRDDPGATAFEDWDERFYERPKAERDPSESWFTYGAARDGLFGLCEELFGISFRRDTEAVLWHPTVEAFEVRRAGRPIGRCYLDSVEREGKQPGGFMAPIRMGSAGIQLPEGVLVMPIVPPGVPVDSARIVHWRVVGFFHEFGHLLHHLLSGGGRWVLNGLEGLESDFVEVPSILFEEWAWDPTVLARLARDPATGGPPSPVKLAQIRPPADPGRPARWLHGLALSVAALRLYSASDASRTASHIVHDALDELHVRRVDPEVHLECGWNQIVAYGASNYTYHWSCVLARDLLTPFRDAGSLMDPGLATRYAREILEAGATRPADECVRRFLGRAPSREPFRRWVAG